MKMKYVSVMIAMTMVLTTWVKAGESLCPRFAISSVEESKVTDYGKYSAVKTSDLKIHVLFSDNFTEEHVVTLKFYTPAGHFYRQIDIPISSESGRGVIKRSLPGYPYPVTVSVPEANRSVSSSDPSIEIRFPVGGTSIATSSLFGVWSVTGLVDGKELRCFRPMSFVIVQ